MRIDRATTKKAVAMLEVTLSFYILLALITFASFKPRGRLIETERADVRLTAFANRARMTCTLLVGVWLSAVCTTTFASMTTSGAYRASASSRLSSSDMPVAAE
jgi:hypothetical protein